MGEGLVGRSPAIRLEGELGATADDRTLEIESDRVTAWALWDADNEALE